MPTAAGGIKGSFGRLGNLVASASVVEERKKVCGVCPNNRFGTCVQCGCVIAGKVRVAAALCPTGRWGFDMLYAKVKAGEVLKYPYTFDDLLAENPSTSFSYTSGDLVALYTGTNDAQELGSEVVPVVVGVMAGRPQYNYVLDSAPKYVGDQWVLQYIETPKQGEALADAVQQHSAIVREKIAEAIFEAKETSAALTGQKKAEWDDYINALANAENSPEFPWGIARIRRPSL